MNADPAPKKNKALKILGIIGLTLVIIVVALIVIIRIALNDFIKFNREIERGNYCLSEQDYDEAEEESQKTAYYSGRLHAGPAQGGEARGDRRTREVRLVQDDCP